MKRYHFAAVTSAIGSIQLPPVDAPDLDAAWDKAHAITDTINQDDAIETAAGHVYISIDNESLTVDGVDELDEQGNTIRRDIPSDEY